MHWAVPLSDLVVEDDDLRAVTDTYRSGWLSMGPRTRQFEDLFARFVGTRHAVAVTNGTAALHLMCLAVGLTTGDEVIVPSLTFVATANAVRYTGATPVFADIAGLARPWLSAASCEQVITSRTKAVLYVAYGGHAGEIGALRDLCARRGLILLEDAAHAAGSWWHGRHLGTFGTAGAFSMFANKNLAVGEGGVVVTADPDIADRVRLLRSHGMTTLTWDRHQGHAHTYDVVALGYNYRIDEPRATLAACRLRRLAAENQRRARLDARYREALGDLDVMIPGHPVDAVPGQPVDDGCARSHHLFAVVLPADVDRDAFRGHLSERGVQTSVHYPPVHRSTVHAAPPGSPRRELPLTDRYAARTVTLPMFAHMRDDQQEQVVSATGKALALARTSSRRRDTGDETAAR
ncbi:DegT/DnrJ/EryC1/StrS aminotransferase [Candidatus Protofrankia datiscae]|uniref:DegT/DnrJ/EryC1/StrS aminotransferase n=2 Tax=Candidatus Protofrankia datiscae TaxID=2716812 RepID=F8B0G4_9ACTN|nr:MULTISPECIES: DegT/DnrJ/EryC1/StrS family aminotransferase [Protofrankia]AEH09713.1 DegT/DnrJ/EryC1/StrS aminotransferase [Candidatus Protofrankia datiscae]